MTGWPLLGMSPQAKLRRLAEAYRAVALMADPAGTAKVDAEAAQVGETWIVPRVQAYAADDLISPSEAAAILCIKPKSLRQLARRRELADYPVGGRRRYRAADIYELQSQVHGRS